MAGDNSDARICSVRGHLGVAAWKDGTPCGRADFWGILYSGNQRTDMSGIFRSIELYSGSKIYKIHKPGWSLSGNPGLNHLEGEML